MESKEDLPLTKVCSTCQQVLQTTSEAFEEVEVEYQTVKMFCDAASDGCFLCSQLRAVMTGFGVPEALNETSWCPAEFRWYGDDFQGKPRVNLGASPPAGLKTSCHWTLFPLRGAFPTEVLT